MRSLLLILGALSLMACSDDLRAAEDGFARDEITGTVHMPLTAQGGDGKSYRLRHATFEIAGAAMFTVGDRDLREPDAETLTTTVPAGNYSMYLRSGWELVERSADGKEQVTAATLASDNPIIFEIGRTLDARIVLKLRAGDKDLVFGGANPMRVTSLSQDADNAL
jgi:hypothetical protein